MNLLSRKNIAFPFLFLILAITISSCSKEYDIVSEYVIHYDAKPFENVAMNMFKNSVPFKLPIALQIEHDIIFPIGKGFERVGF